MFKDGLMHLKIRSLGNEPQSDLKDDVTDYGTVSELEKYEELYELNPAKPDYQYHLLYELFNESQYERMLAIVETALEYLDYSDFETAKQYKGSFFVGKIKALIGLGRVNDVTNELKKALNDHAISLKGLGEGVYEIAGFYFTGRRYEECIWASNKYLETYKDSKTDVNHYDDTLFYKDVFSVNRLNDVCTYLTSCGLQTRDFDMAFSNLNKLDFENENFKINILLIKSIVETMGNVGEEPELKKILSIVFSEKRLKEAVIEQIIYYYNRFSEDEQDNVIKSLKHFPAIIKVVKIKLAEAKNPAKFKEMYDLEAQVLEETYKLEAAGKAKEAKDAREKLRNIMFDAYGILSLHI